MVGLIERRVIERIAPSKQEHEDYERIVLKFKRKLKRASNKLDLKCDFFIGGSFGKNTYLKDNFDVDIFCRFDLSYDDDKLSKYLEAILSKANLKYKIQKGSRDYFTVSFGPRGKKILFEVIPNRKIKNLDDMLNSTDVSPLHVEFIKSKVIENPVLPNQIRLAKQFFKAKGLYGAESYINGFSGHSIDLLIAYFGTLENLIKSAKTWEERTFIDICSFYNDSDEAFKSIGDDKVSNLVLIDPIIKNRNASRALNNEKYCEFLLIANNFERFEEKDFIVLKPNAEEIISDVKQFSKENNLNFLIYRFKIAVKNESEDIVGSKMLKLFHKTMDFYESYDFEIFREDFFIDISKGVCLFIFLFEKKSLPLIKKIVGPKAYMKEAVIAFLKGRDRYFIEESRVCVYEKRVVEKISNISNISVEDFQRMLNKDISFVKSVRIIK